MKFPFKRRTKNTVMVEGREMTLGPTPHDCFGHEMAGYVISTERVDAPTGTNVYEVLTERIYNHYFEASDQAEELKTPELKTSVLACYYVPEDSDWRWMFDVGLLPLKRLSESTSNLLWKRPARTSSCEWSPYCINSAKHMGQQIVDGVELRWLRICEPCIHSAQHQLDSIGIQPFYVRDINDSAQDSLSSQIKTSDLSSNDIQLIKALSQAEVVNGPIILPSGTTVSFDELKMLNAQHAEHDL